MWVLLVTWIMEKTTLTAAITSVLSKKRWSGSDEI